jgi:hypothetical protein
VIAALLVQGLLAAAPALEPGPMKAQLQAYFDGETREAYAWGGLGLLGLGAGSALLAQEDRLDKGAAWPLLGVGLLQLALGTGLFIRTPGQVADLAALLDAHPADFGRQERARMERVNFGFRVYSAVEASLLTVGGGVALAGLARDSRVLMGVGLGTVVEMGVMLVLDHLASERAAEYTARLDAFR